MVEPIDTAGSIRRDFAAGWASVGEAWGIAPSTAAVQGYLLVGHGPMTETDLRTSLGLSHKAAFGAIVECRRLGLVEPAQQQRSGARGPAGRAWAVVGDHWEWFRRVAASRLERETNPVLPLVDGCLRRAEALGDDALVARLRALGTFAHEFDRSMGAVTTADAQAIGHLVGVLADLEPAKVTGLLGVLSEVPRDELVAAAERIAGMRPEVIRRLVRLAARPGVAGLLDRLA
jgi:DNA-binding transcriptional regulator GbsR (MarR family)/HAMP domain-containing protein